MAEALSHFASPAKRRKLSFTADEEVGVSCGQDRKAASSPLKGKMVTPQKKFTYNEPSTPGSKAGMDDGLLSVSPEQLPANLMLLNQLLGALYVTMPLVKSRGKLTTYQNLKGPVQNFSGRDFQVRHVQQIRALCPGALDWEYVLTANTSTMKQEQQLLIKMPTNKSNLKQTFDTAQMQQTFFKSLQQLAQKHQGATGEPQVPLAELPPLAGPNARDCTPSKRGITPPELLPGTPQTAPPPGVIRRTGVSIEAQQHLMMSPPPKRPAATCFKGASAGLMSPPPARTRGAKLRQSSLQDAADDFTFSPAPKAPSLDTSKLFSPAGAFSNQQTSVKAAEGGQSTVSARTPVVKPNKLFGTPLAAVTPQQTTSSRPTDRHCTPVAAEPCSKAAASGIKARKLTFEATASSTSGAEAQRRTKSGITFELGGSAMALLQQVSDVEVKKEQAARQQQLEEQRALDMLPGTFDVLRAVFGDKGPCVKPKTEVQQLMRQKSTSKFGMSPADASEQLELMLRFVPEFVRTFNASGQSLAGMTQSVRINRQVPWAAARQKLLAAANEARSAGAAAAASAISADKASEYKDLEATEDYALDSGDGSDISEPDDAGMVAEASLSILDQNGIDSILAELGSGGSEAGVKAASPVGVSSKSSAVSDEASTLLGGATAGGTCKARGKTGTPGRMSACLVSCLAFQAPKKKL